MRALLIRDGLSAEKLRLVYNAIESTTNATTVDGGALRQLHGISADRTVVGVIGRLNPEKGQMVFLAALKQVIARCPHVLALLIGDGQDRERLEHYSQENGLTEHVIFAGYRENIADYYRIVDLLVLPSLSEGLPNTVLEAMAVGVPVLATSVGGVPEIIDGNNGVTVPPNDSVALSEQLIRLLESDTLRRTIGANGRAGLYPRFAPERRVREILSVYDELLSPSQAATTTRRNA